MPIRRLNLGRLTAAAVLVVGIGLLACMPFLGEFLSIEDPLERADAILVLGGSLADRPLEAAALYDGGYAPRIVLSAGANDYASVLLASRGISVPSPADHTRAVLLQLGVPDDGMLVLPGNPSSTRDEASAMGTMAAENGWRSVIVVTSKLHTRRARLAMRHYLEPAGVRVIVRGSRYDRSDPSRWWRRRSDVRMALTELQFWIAYALGLAL